MRNNEDVTLLIVEDDPGHARLIEKNLRRVGVNNDVIKLENGQEALDFLFSTGDWEGRVPPSPLVVILDLNMPVVDGYEVISRMKDQEKTKRIPVVVLTTTDDPREIQKCYDMGCNAYVTKPVEYEKFAESIRELGVFLSVMAVPNGSN